ncbi:MAG TPA: effector binding domain-containing protein [Eubacteriales bacterium]|nr:effector binding domain-containing protein [Clostridia bacterium]HRV73256.1 effector binding domain-containing protein [Eubacteriales bacterium]
MANIIGTELADMPKLKFIGKKYLDEDRNEYGTYGHRWGEWFKNGWFNLLCGNGGIEGVSDSYIGLERCNNGTFEYYIGIFMAASDPVPEGFISEDIPAGKVFMCHIKGREDTGEIYGEAMTRRCFAMMEAAGYKPRSDGWQFEGYGCPSFTEPDEKGRVILDYGIYAADED